MKRIALIMHGGIAPRGWDVPAITGLIRDLSNDFDITVYTGTTPGGIGPPVGCGNAEVRPLPYYHGDPLIKFVILAVRAFRRDHIFRPYSLVHGFWGLPGGLAAVLAGKLAGIQSVVSFLGGEAASLPAIGYGNMRKAASRSLTLWTSRRTDELVFLTRFQLDRLQGFGFARTDGVHIIPFGSDPELFPPVALRQAGPPYHLLHIGHLNQVKDQQTLLNAFRDISRRTDCQLRIVGEGALESRLRRQARELGISDRVAFLGFVHHDELWPHFEWAHLLIHSSLYEGEGVVFAEAAASGVPVCGTRVGLLADLSAGFAVTVDPGDSVALAEAASNLLEDNARMESLSSEGRAWAEEHTAQWSASRYAELYTRRIEHRTQSKLYFHPGLVDQQ